MIIKDFNQIVVKELSKNNLVPSENILLSKFHESQLELFLNLVKVGYVEQSNLDYAIGEISEIKEAELITLDELKRLYFFDRPDINSKTLKFIFDEMKRNSDIGISHIQKLPRSVLLFPQVFDILESDKLRTLDLTNEVIDICVYIQTKYLYKKNEFEQLEEKIKFENIHKLILDNDIIDSFETCENVVQRKYYYYNMLKSFLDNPDFDICYKFLSNIAKKKRITELKKIPDIINLCFELRLKSQLHRHKTFEQESLENILITICDWNSIKLKSLYLLFGFGLNNGNDDAIYLANLTSKIYEKLPRELADKIYNRLLYNLTHACSCKMEILNDFISSLLDNDNFITYLTEDNGFDFINYALCNSRDTSKEEIFEMYKTIGLFSDKLLYKELLDSFSDDLCYGVDEIKRIIYSQSQVLDTFVENSEALTVLNAVMRGKFVNIAEPMPESEMELLQKPEFLKSDFFLNDYIELLDEQTLKLRTRMSTDSEIYFKIIGAFDFRNNNFSIFARRIFCIDDTEKLKRIYEAAIRNNKDGEFINNSIFYAQMITANDEIQINRYIATFNGFDIKDSVKVPYQKKRTNDNFKI